MIISGQPQDSSGNVLIIVPSHLLDLTKSLLRIYRQLREARIPLIASRCNQNQISFRITIKLDQDGIEQTQNSVGHGKDDNTTFRKYYRCEFSMVGKVQQEEKETGLEIRYESISSALNLTIRLGKRSIQRKPITCLYFIA